MTFETIITEVRGAVGIITLNRPQALNALNSQLIADMNAALENFDRDDSIRCLILTGSEKAFAAGADIREMIDFTAAAARQADFLKPWDYITTIKKPIIAAVSGFCLGGGFEFALACDIIIAAETAKFAFPEITLAILPGGGGTQRLAKAVGKSKAMELVLTGRTIDAQEAEKLGIVARVVLPDALPSESLAIANRIAGFSGPAVEAAKQAVNTALESPLSVGINRERQLFYDRFDSDDQKEGMRAFLEKRKPAFKHR